MKNSQNPSKNKMNIAILPTLIPDIQKTYEVFFNSFQHDKMGSKMLEILFPGGTNTKEFRQLHTTETTKFWHHSTDQYTMKAVDSDNNGDIVGMELLDIYLNERSEEERKYLGIPWLEGEQRERADKVIGALCEAHEKIWGGRKHIGKF